MQPHFLLNYFMQEMGEPFPAIEHQLNNILLVYCIDLSSSSSVKTLR